MPYTVMKKAKKQKNSTIISSQDLFIKLKDTKETNGGSSENPSE